MLLTQPSLLDNLRKGYLGSYGIILSLLGCLDNGMEAKRLVDRIIDACKCLVPRLYIIEIIKCNTGDQVTNLREDIFKNRVKYSLTATMDESEREEYLDKAIKAMEK